MVFLRGRLRGSLGGGADMPICQCKSVGTPNPHYCPRRAMVSSSCRAAKRLYRACGAERLGGMVSLARPLAGRRYGVQGGNPPAFSFHISSHNIFPGTMGAGGA